MPAPLNYRIKLRLLSPLLPLLLLLELKRRGGGFRFLQQRLGFGYPACNNQPLWLHVASVGELNTALPLLARLQHDYPQKSLIVTTNTATAARLVEKQNSIKCSHYYLPVDFPGAVHRFIKTVQPRLGLILETELWPNLYAECTQHRIPLLLINARLSSKSTAAPGWIRQAQRYCVEQLDHILARAASDTAQFLFLGAPAGKIATIDNLKYAPSLGTTNHSPQTVTTRPYVLAASTHQDEEWQFAKLLTPVLKHHNHLLVITPRHPERRDSILRQLTKLPLAIAVRSRNEPVNTQTDVYLLDSMGELQNWFSGATLVLIGGSWIPHGGQNILEPARAGKATIVGPHMQNFATETTDLIAHRATLQLHSASELVATVEQLLQQPESAAAMGQNAMQFMQQKADVVDKYMRSLQKIPAFQRVFEN